MSESLQHATCFPICRFGWWGARNLVIDVAAGAEFAFFLGTGVQFVHCTNVTVHGNGLAVDSLGPNFAQGEVLRWEATKPPYSAFVGQFDPAFLAPDSTRDPFSRPGAPHGAHAVFWDPRSRTMLPGLSSMSLHASTPRHRARAVAGREARQPGHVTLTPNPGRPLTQT